MVLVLKYDPFALAFYNNQKKLKANPILTAEKADEKLVSKYTLTEYMPFNYNIKPVEINKDFSVPSEILVRIVEEYFDISNAITGYSPDEKIYYMYITVCRKTPDLKKIRGLNFFTKVEIK